MLVKNIEPSCKTCGGKMTALFYTVVCDLCENPATGWLYHGYIVWMLNPDELWVVQEHPIFRYEDEAQIWRGRQYNPDILEVRHVLSYKKLIWKPMPFAAEFEIASSYQLISNTHKYERQRNIVMLTARDVYIADQECVYVSKQASIELGLNK
jgi:hypothetical protein